MKTILCINSSSRSAAPTGSETEGSFSRALAGRMVSRLTELYPYARLVERDLIADPINHISDATIKGYYTPVKSMTPELEAATAQSDELIAELKSADIIVISAPIYNFSVPSALKAWIDQIVRIGHTFSYENGQFAGLVADRSTYLLLSYGAAGYAPGEPLETFDFLRPYLIGVMNFIGLRSTEVIAVEATTAPDAETNLAKAFADIDTRLGRTFT